MHMSARKKLLLAAAAAGLTALVGLVMISYARPPEDLARKARRAQADLRDTVKADRWAPDEYAAAAEAFGAADRELRTQNARFFMTRDYTNAAELYERALEDAALATGAALAGKESAEKEAREALDAAQAAIVHAQAALTIAPVSRDSRSSFDLLNQQLDRAAVRLDEVRNMIVAENYDQATERAEEILEQVTSMLRNVSRSMRR